MIGQIEERGISDGKKIRLTLTRMGQNKKSTPSGFARRGESAP